jgi:hypothetical protein
VTTVGPDQVTTLTDATAIDLLHVLAVLAPTGVPVSLLPPAGKDASETTQLLGRVSSAIGILLESALFTETTGGATLLMHRLTQRVIREDLARAGQLEEARERAAKYISRPQSPRTQATRPHGQPAPSCSPTSTQFSTWLAPPCST